MSRKAAAELVEQDSQYAETETDQPKDTQEAHLSPEIDLGLPEVEPSETQIAKFKVNRAFLVLYILTLSLNGICVAYTTGGNNQTASIFAAKLDWDGAETRKYNTYINLSSQVGKTIGATLGGRLITNGRRRIFVIFNILAILS